MSTYNSKFSGAEIDALLEKVASGQVGGSGSSEKEELAKEVGATHKHTITVAAEIPQYGIIMKFRFVTYLADSTPLTIDTLTSLMAGLPAYINGYQVTSASGQVIVSDAILGISDSDEPVLMVGYMGATSEFQYARSVDFTAQTVDTGYIETFAHVGPVPVQTLIDNSGATFTDDVTEL